MRARQLVERGFNWNSNSFHASGVDCPVTRESPKSEIACVGRERSANFMRRDASFRAVNGPRHTIQILLIYPWTRTRVETEYRTAVEAAASTPSFDDVDCSRSFARDRGKVFRSPHTALRPPSNLSLCGMKMKSVRATGVWISSKTRARSFFRKCSLVFTGERVDRNVISVTHATGYRTSCSVTVN